MTHDVDEMETKLEGLFRAQANAVDVPDRDWSDVPMAPVVSMETHRTTRTKKAFVVGGSVLVAAVCALVVAFAGVGSPKVQTKAPVASNADAPRPLVFKADSNRVTLAATAYKVVADGKTFTTQGTPVEVHGDPGGSDYWTIELAWHEQGVEQRMNMYFASDGNDWWVSEIRLYNGKAEGDWITWTGEFFKTPVGKPYVGDVNLVDKASGGSLTITNMELTTTAKKFNCAAGTGKYAIGTSFERPAIELMAGGSETGTSLFLLDRTSCTKVDHPERYTMAWTSDDASVASVVPAKAGSAAGPNKTMVVGEGDCSFTDQPAACLRGFNPDYKAGHAGTTVLHGAAKDTATGEIVARRDFPVTVGSNGASNPGGNGPAGTP
jgi:hypothetical protein